MVFNIKSGIKFWDGTPLTSADVRLQPRAPDRPQVGGFYGAVFNRVKSIDRDRPAAGHDQAQAAGLLAGRASCPHPGLHHREGVRRGGRRQVRHARRRRDVHRPVQAEEVGRRRQAGGRRQPALLGQGARSPRPPRSTSRAVPSDRRSRPAIETGEITGELSAHRSRRSTSSRPTPTCTSIWARRMRPTRSSSRTQGRRWPTRRCAQALSMAIDRQG